MVRSTPLARSRTCTSSCFRRPSLRYVAASNALAAKSEREINSIHHDVVTFVRSENAVFHRTEMIDSAACGNRYWHMGLVSVENERWPLLNWPDGAPRLH